LNVLKASIGLTGWKQKNTCGTYTRLGRINLTTTIGGMNIQNRQMQPLFGKY
jgi:hypothetical protein